jgi:hypothetical protein
MLAEQLPRRLGVVIELLLRPEREEAGGKP